MTSTNSLTEQQLDDIETRAAHLREYGTLTDEPLQEDLDRLTDIEVPALLAEVRRLRAELAAAPTPHTPRLCACGHSHRAHTVPAPHSCFAHGQTCPCPAFRQLPHDEAVAQLKRNRMAAAACEADALAP